MKSINQKYIQLFVRVALATTFLSAVADRLGYWGKPGSPGVSWGNWENFLTYSNQLNFFVPQQVGALLAIAATFLEVFFALLLLVGYKTRIVSISSGILLTLFAVTMTVALGIKSTFDYSVWIGVAGSFLLSTVSTYHYSLDNYFQKNETKN